MFCPNCGADNPDSATSCVNCHSQLPVRVEPGAAQPKIPNYLVHAILVTLFCCLPFGIVAIVYAAQVDGKASSGDLAGAQEASNKAKMWCWISFGLGLAGIAIWLVFAILTAVMHAS